MKSQMGLIARLEYEKTITEAENKTKEIIVSEEQ